MAAAVGLLFGAQNWSTLGARSPLRPFGEASLPRENSAWMEGRLIDLAEFRSATLLPTKFRHKLARC